MSDTLTAPPAPELHKGLAGVVVDRTAVSSVDAASNSLLYRGYPVQQLAAEQGLAVGEGYFTDFSQERIVELYMQSAEAEASQQ